MIKLKAIRNACKCFAYPLPNFMPRKSTCECNQYVYSEGFVYAGSIQVIGLISTFTFYSETDCAWHTAYLEDFVPAETDGPHALHGVQAA